MAFSRTLSRLLLAALALGVLAGGAQAEDRANRLFGAKKLPAEADARSYGFYSHGCLAGAVAIPADGPTWEAMRLSRNRRWGHPAMIALIEKLSRDAVADGWPGGLLLGDIAQPRGGPMLDGHASHQIGLDADIWLTPKPARTLSATERETMEATVMVDPKTHLVRDRLWTPAHTQLLRRAASYPQVERIFVNPGIKKKLCDTVRGDRSWLAKIRPMWGHDYHFHIRIACQPGSIDCKPQAPTGADDGCGKPLAWWFTDEPWRPNTDPEAPKARDLMTLNDLPKACRAVLAAPSPPSEAAATFGGMATAAAGAGPVAAGAAVPAMAFAATPDLDIPLPIARPRR